MGVWQGSSGNIIIWSPVTILCMWVVAVVVVIAFGGAYRLPGFCGNQHVRDPTWNQNPFLNRLGNGSRSCFVGLRCFGNTSSSFHFAFICMHFPSYSFHLHAYSFHFALISCHVPFICIHFPSFSFHSLHSCHFHSNVHSCPFIFRSLHFPFILHSCPFISFLELWKWLYGLARRPSATNGYR